MRKVFLAFVAVLLTVSILIAPASAAETQNDMMPMSMQTTVCGLSISGMKAEYYCSISSVSTDSLSATLYLQKYKNGEWTTVQSGSASTTNHSLIIEKWKLITAGKFRAKAVVTATKGTQKETITYYSAVKTKE